MLIKFLDVVMSGLKLLYQLWILRLEEVPLPPVGRLAVVQTLLVLHDELLAAPVLRAGAEQTDYLPVGHVRSLLLFPGRGELVEYHSAVDGQPPKNRK